MYVKLTDYGAKDSLLTGNPLKIVRGTELGAEFDSLATEDALNVKTSGNQSISGIKTFNSSPIIPNATTSTQAVAFGQVGSATITETHAAASKATPVDADELPLADSASSFSLKKLTWGNLKTTLNTLYLSFAGGNLTGGLNEARGTVVMHATTMDLWAQPNIIDGTGSAVTITAIVNAPQAGARRTLYPITGTIITHGATFSVDGNASYTTLAGDALIFEAVTVSTYNVGVIKQDGSAVQVFPPYSAIAGFTLSSIAGTSTTASCTVSTGQATALQGSATTQTTQITKASTTSWAVSNGNAINGYDGGTTLPNNSTIHIFMCSGASGTGSFASTSLTPTFPTGYAVSARRVNWFNTTGAGAPLPGVDIEIGGGAVRRWHTTQTEDVSVTNLSTSRVLYPLNVPNLIKTQPILRVLSAAAGAGQVILTSGDETDVAPVNGTTVPMYDAVALTTSAVMPVLTTDTSKQIGARATAAASYLYIVTRGCDDFRRS